MQPTDIRKSCIAALAALGLAVALAGCGGGGGGGGAGPSPAADITPPTVTVTSYTKLLSATGGSADITALVTDAGGVARVEAKITAPDSTVSTLPMPAKGGGSYGASFQAPANSTTLSKEYAFTVYAYDNAGNQGPAGPYTFMVPSAENPPNPPPFTVN